MILADVLMIAVGAALAVLGYLIRYRRKYALINGWEQSKRTGSRQAAEKLGRAELIVGTGWAVLGVIGLFMQSEIWSGVSMAAGVIALLAALRLAVK